MCSGFLTPAFPQTRKLSGALAGGNIQSGNYLLSRDGAHVAFSGNFRSTLGGREVYVAPADGSGEPRKIFPLLQRGGVFSILHDGYRGDALYLAPLDGSAPARKLSRMSGPHGEVHWVYHEEARGHVVFLANEAGLEYGRYDVFVAPIDGSAPARRVNGVPGANVSRFRPTPLQIHPDGHSVLYLAHLVTSELCFLGLAPSSAPREW